MKTQFVVIVTFLLAAVCCVQPLRAQSKVETRFAVRGVCEMCKKRIENATDIKGVVFSEWNAEKQELFLVYKPKMVTLETIHKRIQAVGHDTELGQASDSAYSKIHSCCRYRTEKESHISH